jgi:diguanylate cyclase (GGDEF)-like protein
LLQYQNTYRYLWKHGQRQLAIDSFRCLIGTKMDKPFAIIAEDDRDMAALLRHAIDMAGFRTEIAFHGEVAIDRIFNSRPDIVILGLNLPGISGSKILEMIRKNRRLSQTKVILVTADGNIADSLSEQPDLILLRPTNIDQLTGLVSRFELSIKGQEAIPIKGDPVDDVTGLYNQPFFINRLESALKQAQEIDGYLFAVFLFTVESKYGVDRDGAQHLESTLHEIADSLRGMLRPTDTLARFDPNSFYVLIENIPNGEISIMIANRIQKRLNQEIMNLEDKIKMPFRIGILLCGDGYAQADQIIADAKYALALTKAQGDEYAKYYYQFSVKH